MRGIEREGERNKEKEREIERYRENEKERGRGVGGWREVALRYQNSYIQNDKYWVYFTSDRYLHTTKE